MKKEPRIKIKYLLLQVLTVVIGALLIYALVVNAWSDEQPLIRSETMYLLIVFLALLPLLLIIFIIVTLVGKKESTVHKIELTAENSEIVLSSNGENAPVAPPAQPPQEEKKEESAPEQESEEESNRERFCMLCRLDESRQKFKRESYDTGVTLKKLCDNFRNYACRHLRLYYDISDIRRFIAGMAVTHIIILQGMSGTGKTSLAHAYGEFLENPSTVIPVQPMWKERTDLIGYYNEFTKRFNETKLLQKMYEANYSEDVYITVLDEMNIARVEYYFAEFLSLLELPNPDERYLDVVSDKWENDPEQLVDGRIKLPKNMWFIGTANNDDSTFAISDKVYDRAMVLNLDSKCEPFTAPKTKKMHVSAQQFKKLVEQAQKEYEITKRNLKRLELLDAYMIEHFHITFGNRIMKQIKTYIPVFVACGGNELDALDDILSKKVMRKLEMQNPVYVRNSAEGFCNYLEELFGEEGMPLCKAFIRRLERNA